MTRRTLGAAVVLLGSAAVGAVSSNQKYSSVRPSGSVEPEPLSSTCRCAIFDHVANAARPAYLRVAMSTSFGLGGHNSALVMTRAADGEA